MTRGSGSRDRGEEISSLQPFPSFWQLVGVLLFGLTAAPLRAQIEDEVQPLFNWDIISLEQNNPRFNGSVLTGFHSVRSPGVTPVSRWKIGLGALYTREEQFSEASGSSVFRRNQVLVDPKLNYGFAEDFEAGVGFVASYARGREMVSDGMGGVVEQTEEAVEPSSVDLGVKWNFLDTKRFRLALAFDTRLALSRGDFGALPANFFNVEVDADFAVTGRFSMVGNLQFVTSDSADTRDQFIIDVAATYTFSDRFRGMLFGTVQEDDEANTVLGFIGIAGQYVIGQHSFTLAFDLQLNDASREVRTEEQLDIELSYTFTF